MLADLALLYRRELATLDAELAAFPNDAAVWASVPGQPNSAGTLTLHLCGNLRHFIGGVLGGSGYQRNREAEFSRRDLPIATLREEIAATQGDVASAFERIDPARLSHPLPLTVGKDVTTTTQRFLLHLLSHLAY
ncbi:MAG: DUF1572 domain-containing protein, partial [Dehalococcoidia bacterium]|nr:DUF1572 domain-containing protein [Dehalococcoidia bacterium]